MKPEDLRAFAARDWKRVAAAKAQYWADRMRTLSPAAALALADQLRQHARALHPDWPSDQERDADIRAHTELSKALQSVHR